MTCKEIVGKFGSVLQEDYVTRLVSKQFLLLRSPVLRHVPISTEFYAQ